MSISPEFREYGRFPSRRVPEKTSFSQTCNMLSQYLKENGSFGDLSFGASLNGDSEKSQAMDLFPQHVGFGDSPSKEQQAAKSSNLQQSEASKPMSMSMSMSKPPQQQQMTIVYGGKVIVFDGIVEEKAKELMMIASSSSLSSNLDAIPPHVSGLPIARKASLHRFLEKRKDRINARAPYQLNLSVGATTKSDEEKKTWLGLASPFL